jgi:hypothetical protein
MVGLSRIFCSLPGALVTTYLVLKNDQVNAYVRVFVAVDFECNNK